MPNNEKPIQKLTTTIKNITEIIVLILALLFGFYEFVYKQHLAPQSSANITVNIELQRIKVDNSKVNNLIPIKMLFKAKNTGMCKVNLLPNIFFVGGGKIVRREIDLVEYLFNNPFVKKTKKYIGKHFTSSKIELIAYGGVFDDDHLKSDEEIKKECNVYIPNNKYDYLEATVLIYSILESVPSKRIKLEHKIDERTKNRTTVIYLDGKQLITDKNGNYNRKNLYKLDAIGFQQSSSTIQLAL